MGASFSPRRWPSGRADRFNKCCIAGVARTHEASLHLKDRLIPVSDCNDISPNGASAVLAAHRTRRLIQPSQHEAAAPNQRATAPSIGSLLILWGNFGFGPKRGGQETGTN
jgi:hypothetical protein